MLVCARARAGVVSDSDKKLQYYIKLAILLTLGTKISSTCVACGVGGIAGIAGGIAGIAGSGVEEECRGEDYGERKHRGARVR